MDTDNSSPRHLPSLAPLSFPGGQPHHPQQGQQQRQQQQQGQQQQHIQHPQHHSHHPLNASFATGSAGRRAHPEDAIHPHQHQGNQHVPGGSSSVVPPSFNPAGAPPGYWQPMFDVPQNYSPYGHGNPNPAAYSPWTSLHPSSANATVANGANTGPNSGPGGNRPSQENPDQPPSAYGVQAYQLGGHPSLQQQQPAYGSYPNGSYYPSYEQQAWPPRPSPQQPPGQKRPTDKEADNDGRSTDPSSASDHHPDGGPGSRSRQGTFQNANSLPFPPPSGTSTGSSSSGQPHHFPPTFNPNDPYGPYGYPSSSSQPGQPQTGPSLPSMNFGLGGQNQPYGQQPNGYYYPPQPQLPPPSALGGGGGGIAGANNNGGVDMSMVTGAYPPFDVESGDWQGIHPAGKKQKLSGPSPTTTAAAFAAFTAGTGHGPKSGHPTKTGEGPTGKPKKEKKEKIPKPPKEPKPPKAPKEPKVKIPKEPKEPKEPKQKEPKEPKAKKEKTGSAKDSADANVPTKSHLKPPRKPLSAWQIYFNKVLAARKNLIKPGERFNVAEIAKEAGKVYQDLAESEKAVYIAKAKEVKAEYLAAMAAYTATLTPSDIRQENLFRASQRKAGKSRAANLKDPNAPKPPLSPYFLYLRAIRASEEMTREIFRGEKETTKQSIKAAERWKTLSEDEKRPYTSAAEAEKRSFEIAQRQYMIDTGGPVPPIHPPRIHKAKSTASQAAAAASASVSGTYQEPGSVPLVPESIQSFKSQQHHLQPHQLHPTVPLSVGFNPNSSSPSRSIGDHDGPDRPDPTISPSHPGFDDPHDLSTDYHHHHLSAVGSGSGPEDHLGEFDPIFAGVDVDVADHAHNEGDDEGSGGFGDWSMGASDPGHSASSRLGGNKRQRQDDGDEDDQADDRRGDREDDDEDDEDDDDEEDEEDEASGSEDSSHGHK